MTTKLELGRQKWLFYVHKPGIISFYQLLPKPLGQWHSSCNRSITAVTLLPRGFETFQRHHLTNLSFPPPLISAPHPGDLYLNHHIRFRHVQVGAKQEIILLRTKDPQVTQYIAPGRASCPSAYLSHLFRKTAHPPVVFARLYP